MTFTLLEQCGTQKPENESRVWVSVVDADGVAGAEDILKKGGALIEVYIETDSAGRDVPIGPVMY